MVRVVTLTGSRLPDDLPTAGLYHSDPSHPSFQAVAATGRPISAIPPEGIEDGVVLVPGTAPSPLDELVAIVDRLLGPGGCPWDQAQTHETLKRHLVEECYEFIEAIDANSPEAMREELGDLLLQPVMHGQISKANGGFDTADAARDICDKLIRRHPHVFGDVSVENADEVLKNWDTIKQAEKGDPDRSILAGVPKAMPSLLRALEVSKRAARAGFEWPEIDAVFDKLREEEAELREAIATGDQSNIESEVGDLLFTVVNIARWAKVEPEEALRKMLDRFTRRFVAMEKAAAKPLRDRSAEEWDQSWMAAKQSEG